VSPLATITFGPVALGRGSAGAGAVVATDRDRGVSSRSGNQPS